MKILYLLHSVLRLTREYRRRRLDRRNWRPKLSRAVDDQGERLEDLVPDGRVSRRERDRQPALRPRAVVDGPLGRRWSDLPERFAGHQAVKRVTVALPRWPRIDDL